MTLPLIGAALRSDKLGLHAEWLVEGGRDIEIQDPAWYAVLDEDWQPLVAQIKTQLAGHTGRIGIHGPFISLPTASVDPAVRAVVTRRHLQALDFTEALGGTHMVIHSPFQVLGAPFMPNTEWRFIDATRETLKEVVARAEAIGCTLMIENVFDTDPRPLVDLVRSFESDHVRVSVDVGHAYINYHHRAAPPPDHWIRAAGDLLGHVHLQDTDGYSDRHWLPGEGDMKWHTVFRALQDAKNPRLIIEVNDQESIQDAAGWLAAQGLVE